MPYPVSGGEVVNRQTESELDEMIWASLLLVLWGAGPLLSDVGVTNSNICMRSGILTKLRPIPIWEGQNVIINRAKIITSLTSITGLITKSSENAATHMRQLKTGSSMEGLPDFVHDATHKWLGPELEDAIVEVENVAPGQIATKCRAAKARPLLFYDEYSTQVYFQKLAVMKGITHLVPESYYGAEGLRERYTGDLMQLYGTGESAEAAKTYKPAVFNVATGKFMLNYGRTIAKTLCIKHQRFYEMSKTHLAVHSAGYDALTSALSRLGSFMQKLIKMLSGLNEIDKSIEVGSTKEAFVNTWQISQLFEPLLVFSDKYYHQKYDNQIMEQIRSFITMTDLFLGNNIIINDRQVVLKIAHTKIAELVGLEKGVIGAQPYVRVTLVARRKNSEFMDAHIEAIVDDKAALFVMKPIIRQKKVTKHPYVTITPRSKFTSMRPPILKCTRLPFLEVCDVEAPSSDISFDCAEYLLGNVATRRIQDHCPMTSPPSPIIVISGVSCLPDNAGGTIISSSVDTRVKLACPRTGTKTTVQLLPNKPALRPANETDCNVVMSDGTPIRQLDAQREAHEELVVNELRADADDHEIPLSTKDKGINDPLVQGLAISLGVVGAILLVIVGIIMLMKHPTLAFNCKHYICQVCRCCNPAEADRLQNVKRIMDMERKADIIQMVRRRNEAKAQEMVEASQRLTADPTFATASELGEGARNAIRKLDSPFLQQKDNRSKIQINVDASAP